MQVGTKEYYEMLEQFEQGARSLIRTGSQGFKREAKENWSRGIVYVDGGVNEAFKIWSHGYSCGRCEYMNR